MTIIEHLQRLDALIVENTKPPVTAMLRNQLALAIEQCEAYQAAADKQDQTLAAQIKTIERLMKANEDLNMTIADLQASNKASSLQAIDPFDHLL